MGIHILPKKVVKKKEELPEYKKFRNLSGVPIRLSQDTVDYVFVTG